MRPISPWPLTFLCAGLWLGAVACSDDATLPDARLPADAPPTGTFTFSWTISHQSAALTCAQVDAPTVTFELVPDGAAFGVVDSLGCASGTGESRALAPGKYTVRATLDGSGIDALDGPKVLVEQVVVSGQTTTVAPFAFDVDPHGDLLFRISTPATGGNCAPAGAGTMGAGITSTSIELRDAAGTCIPTTFLIAAGASLPAGTYVSNCTGATFACIAADQDIRANGVTAGQHSMAIVGNVAAAPCWKRTSSFKVRAAGQLLTLNQQQLILDGTVANCPM